MRRTTLGVGAVTAEAAIAQACASELPAIELFERVARHVRRVVPYDAGCWKPTDPHTLLFTGFAIEDPEAGRLSSVRWRFVDNELLEPDFAKFRRLARKRQPVTTLDEATHGERERSARYREIHRALGFGAELRAVFRTRDSCWGGVALVRDEGRPDFSKDEVAFVARICDHIALGLRVALLRETDPQETESAPGMIVLRDDLTIESLTSQARHWLERFPADRGTGLELPAAVVAVARRAQLESHAAATAPPAAARVRLRSGRWLLVHAAPLGAIDSSDCHIAVVVAPAGPVQITPLRLELHDLTNREREVTRLLIRGLTNAEIARALHITRHTVKDHAKAIYAKLGVTSRSELTGKLFYEQHVPRLDADRLREWVPNAN